MNMLNKRNIAQNQLVELKLLEYLTKMKDENFMLLNCCLLYTSPSPRDGLLSRMPSSA